MIALPTPQTAESFRGGTSRCTCINHQVRDGIKIMLLFSLICVICMYVYMHTRKSTFNRRVKTCRSWRDKSRHETCPVIIHVWARMHRWLTRECIGDGLENASLMIWLAWTWMLQPRIPCQQWDRRLLFFFWYLYTCVEALPGRHVCVESLTFCFCKLCTSTLLS